jgi:hypothetical protein
VLHLDATRPRGEVDHGCAPRKSIGCLAKICSICDPDFGVRELNFFLRDHDRCSSAIAHCSDNVPSDETTATNDRNGAQAHRVDS